MKVLALNSSPRGAGESKTELMLNELVKGMREAGAEVDLVSLRTRKIRNCVGCFTCWTKTPGVCIHKDDMTGELFPRWLESDLVVYASPLYHYTVNATMKAFIERTLPVLQPFFEEKDGHSSHPLSRRHPAVVMLSVAGFPEDSVFEQLSSWTRFVFHRGLRAEIYRAAAESLNVPFFADKKKDILEATVQAGRELVETMQVKAETMARITQPLFDDLGTFRKLGNLFWKACIEEGLTPREFDEKGCVPRPDSIETFLTIMCLGFNPEAAGDARGIMQFDFTGRLEGSCHLKIENGEIEGLPGPADSPNVTIQAPFDLWMDISTGKADGQQMFMEQKYKVAGDLSLLMRMGQLFRK